VTNGMSPIVGDIKCVVSKICVVTCEAWSLVVLVQSGSGVVSG